MVDPDGAPEQAGRNGRMNVRIDDKVIIFLLSERLYFLNVNKIIWKTAFSEGLI